MGEFILWLQQLQTPLRVGLGLALAGASVLALIAWLERTRRVSAFGALGRFSRRVLDPALAPLDRIVARTGGRRTVTPWWGLFAVLVVGAVVIGLVDFLRESLAFAYYASSQGPRSVLRLVVSWSFGLLQLAVMLRVVTSWVGGSHSWVGRTAFTLTEWLLAPLRRVLPPIGMMDLSPIVAYFAIALLRSVIVGAI